MTKTGNASAPLAERIVSATERRLREGADPAGLSLRAIARDVGVTAPAIYTHFPTKDDIITAVLARQFAELDSALDDAGGRTPEERLIAKCLAYCDFGLERSGAYLALFGPAAFASGVAYDGSPGAATFERLVSAVAPLVGSAAAHERAVALWSALHGAVSLRTNLPGFPWPPLERQVELLCDAVAGG